MNKKTKLNNESHLHYSIDLLQQRADSASVAHITKIYINPVLFHVSKEFLVVLIEKFAYAARAANCAGTVFGFCRASSAPGKPTDA